MSPLIETAWLLGDARAAAGDAAGSAEAYALVVRGGKSTDPRTLSLFLSTRNKSAADNEESLKLAREEYETRKDIASEEALAWALYRTGNVADAKASIIRARRLGTPDARLMFHEGAIRIAAGETAKGTALVKAALKRNPAFDRDGVREASALLAERMAAR